MPDLIEQQRLEGLYEKLRLKLLDLSKKNRMLNYSLGVRSQRHLQIVDDVLEDVYARLASEEVKLRISFLPEPDDLPVEEKTEDFLAALEHAKVSDIDYLTKLDALESEGRDNEIELARLERQLRDKVRAQLGLPPRATRAEVNRTEHARSLGIDPGLELQPRRPDDARVNLALQTLKYPDELERIADKILSQARLAEQEMGISTLFLAFGFLEWYEADDSDKKAYAPLLLLPVKLDTEKVRGKEVYYLSAREGAAEANLSLQKLLEQNYNRELSNFEADEEGSIGSIERYLDQTRAAIDGLKRWQIRRWLILGHFAFGRFLIYSDLKRENWREHPVLHPLVNAILSGVERRPDHEPDLPSIPDDYPIDDPEIERIALLLIQDADASQHSALVDVMRGQNLVIHGPPGTGKSQTITNIIANTLAEGKRVLFLSEKQAALDVVKRRLDSAGLGDFCLELHSDKASPKSVIESLKRRSELGWGRAAGSAPYAADMNAIAWNESRLAIARYLSRLHAEAPDGSTPFSLIWKALRGRTLNADLMETLGSPDISAELLLDYPKLASVHARLQVYADVSAAFLTAFGHPVHSPWNTLALGGIQRYDIDRFITKLAELRALAIELAAYFETYAGPLALEAVANLEDIVAIDRSIDDPPAAPLAEISKLDLEELARGLGERRSLIDIDRNLAGRPDLSGAAPQHLALASSLIASEAPTTLLHMRAAEAYAATEEAVERLSSTLRVVESSFPILRVLSLGEDFPTDGVQTLAVAILVASRIPAEHHPWIAVLPDIDEAAFSTAHTGWTHLSASERDWRGRLAKYELRPWPAPGELRAAAVVLRKSGIGGALAAVNGSRRAARALAARLGCTESPAILADSLDHLADHVQAVLHFEADPDAARLLGDHWQGLHSPFDEIAAGVTLRRAVFDQLESFPGGDRIAERITALPAPAFAALADLAGAAQSIQEAKECLRGFDKTPINVTVPPLRAELAAYQRFLLADPERSLAGIDASIHDIAEIATVLAQRTVTTQSLAMSPLAHAIRALGEAEADIDLTGRAIEWVEAARRAVPPGHLRDALTGSDAEAVRRIVREAAAEGAVLSRSYLAIIGYLSSEFGVDQLASILPEALIRRLDLLIARRVELADFLAIRDYRRELDEAGLADFLARCDRIGLAPDRLPAMFEALVAHAQADMARRASPEFGRQSGAALEALRRRFADRDRAKIRSDRAVVAAKLLQKIPARGSDFGPRGTWTDMALLRNEFPKQRRFAPVRSLLSRAGGAIQSLKPCFMMSPLSLAKFARPEHLAFDILLVDEASQMKPEEALGALIRAKQVVVVGDAKQLPPTDFFNRSIDASSADEDFEDIDDESILEACEKTFRQVRPLKWHYRSRCESLISFSNAEFYENSLITFPMARPGSFSIDLVRVDGAYQARRNVAEAVRVAEEAIQFMRYFADMSEATIPSLGIVSINIDQRDLIDEELRRVWAGDELVDRYREKVQQKGEPLFVKNLENVQGDERDFIFISMTYGREPGATALKQRFGPIAGKQGHRRLNVLFSRARMRIALFTSFGSADVRPGELSADGPRVLKRYLEYVETRGRAVVESITNEPDSDFEVEVGERLRAKGYELDFQVGVSGYKIDLAVRHPDHAERFLAGIECDGARYHSSKSARDRDRLREEVLDGLGWAILRVWSTDWFDNPELETDKLVAKLENLRSGPPRTFPDYQMMDAFSQGEPDPVEPVEPHSVNGADGAAAVADGLNPVPPLPGLPANEEPVLTDDGPLTPGQAYKVLEDFRESMINPAMENWEPHRSILRDGMIETFVTQRLNEPSDWFNKVPQFQRSGTNPLEKTLFLARICEIVERIDDGAPGRHPRADLYAPAAPIAANPPNQATLPPAPVVRAVPLSRDRSQQEAQYVIADIASLSLTPRPDRFYETDYRATIGRIADYIIAAEAPVFGDVVVTRIARIHGYSRTGSTIQKLVLSTVEGRFPKTAEDGREVFWPVGARIGMPVSFRASSRQERAHNDVPIAELAGLALPFVRIRMDDEQVLRKMAEYFGLGRLREGTRARFYKAVMLAKSVQA